MSSDCGGREIAFECFTDKEARAGGSEASLSFQTKDSVGCATACQSCIRLSLSPDAFSTGETTRMRAVLEPRAKFVPDNDISFYWDSMTMCRPLSLPEEKTIRGVRNSLFLDESRNRPGRRVRATHAHKAF